MTTQICVFQILEAELRLELTAETWDAVQNAAEKLATKLGATFLYSIEKDSDND